MVAIWATISPVFGEGVVVDHDAAADGASDFSASDAGMRQRFCVPSSSAMK